MRVADVGISLVSASRTASVRVVEELDCATELLDTLLLELATTELLEPTATELLEPTATELLEFTASELLDKPADELTGACISSEDELILNSESEPSPCEEQLINIKSNIAIVAKHEIFETFLIGFSFEKLFNHRHLCLPSF
jgi:hypothetical protein